MSNQEISDAVALLARYPYDPDFDPATVPEGSPERLRGCPPGMRESLAAIYARGRKRWAAEARELDVLEPPQRWHPGAKSEDFFGGAWDVQNCMLRAEWRALYARIAEWEREKGRPLARRAELAQALRKRLMARYGATDVDPVWEEWQEQLDREYPERVKRQAAGSAR